MNISDTVTDLNNADLAFSETDYFTWLKYRGTVDLHAIHTKREYLVERFGFQIRRGATDHGDFINYEALQTLLYIERAYFFHRLYR